VSEALLFGRELEVRVLEKMLGVAGERGGALFLRGDPGVGKSSILAMAKSLAVSRGMTVLSATGVQDGTILPFAGLYELLRPVVYRADRLPGPERHALCSAFGLSEPADAELFLVALGALDLLADAASERPLLLIVDDAQWVDQSSAKVLAFIARRVQSEPIVLLMGGRDNPKTPIDVVVPELRIDPLDEIASIALLQARNPDLPIAVRDRVLRESAGNPLALVELPKTVGSEAPDDGLLDAHLPLTTRLERAFASRVFDLPPPSRQLLLIAAMDDVSNLAEIMSAAKLIGGAELSLETLAKPISAGLVELDGVELRFRHPLVRSAIHSLSNIAERVAAHTALARVLEDDPDRRIWHQAAATIGPDETVAEELESAAARAQQRGDIRIAIKALDRAAEVSNETSRRARCLVQAADLAFDIGGPSAAIGLLQKAEGLDLAPRDRVRLKWLSEAIAGSPSCGQALVEIADNIQSDADVDLVLDVLSSPATRSRWRVWWTDPDKQLLDRVIAAVEAARKTVTDDLRFLVIVAFASPIDRGAFVIERLHRLSNHRSSDAQAALWLGLAAFQVGDFDFAMRFLSSAAAGSRSAGSLAVLAQILVKRAWSSIYLADRNTAIADAAEGERLAGETEQPIWIAIARTAAAMSAALRGEHEVAERLAVQASALPFGPVPSDVQIARGTNALAAGNYDDAYRHFRRMFDPADTAYRAMRHCLHIGDLAEAAMKSDRRDEAKVVLAEMEPLAQRTPSPQFHASLHYARALLADDTEAESLFQTALAAEVVRSPFLRARLHLAFGTWLRRARRPKDARLSLQSAMETFDSLGTWPWSERARQELRAAGVAIEQPTPELREQLTPQELQIALMAAEGLANREIGQKLYLSHRTVESHLYRIFPKLNITSRHQLRDALAGEAPLHA
jgi:DNA-binding CsgD family transcriptional regulator